MLGFNCEANRPDTRSGATCKLNFSHVVFVPAGEYTPPVFGSLGLFCAKACSKFFRLQPPKPVPFPPFPRESAPHYIFVRNVIEPLTGRVARKQYGSQYGLDL